MKNQIIACVIDIETVNKHTILLELISFSSVCTTLFLLQWHNIIFSTFLKVKNMSQNKWKTPTSLKQTTKVKPLSAKNEDFEFPDLLIHEPTEIHK